MFNAGFAVYDGYKAYKAGKKAGKKGWELAGSVAWASGSSFFKLGHIKKTGKVLNAINGNSKKSTKLQHGYVITNRQTGKIVKIGVSGGKLNKNGTSRRANSQVNKWGKDKFKARVITKNVKGRSKILKWESSTAAKLRDKGRLSDKTYHSRP